jgi:hypothetical protein
MWGNKPHWRAIGRQQRLTLIASCEPKRSSFISWKSPSVAGHTDNVDAGSSSESIVRQQICERDGRPLRLGVPTAGAVESRRDRSGTRGKIRNRERGPGNFDVLISTDRWDLVEEPDGGRDR